MSRTRWVPMKTPLPHSIDLKRMHEERWLKKNIIKSVNG